MLTKRAKKKNKHKVIEKADHWLPEGGVEWLTPEVHGDLGGMMELFCILAIL